MSAILRFRTTISLVLLFVFAVGSDVFAAEEARRESSSVAPVFLLCHEGVNDGEVLQTAFYFKSGVDKLWLVSALHGVVDPETDQVVLEALSVVVGDVRYRLDYDGSGERRRELERKGLRKPTQGVIDLLEKPRRLDGSDCVILPLKHPLSGITPLRRSSDKLVAGVSTKVTTSEKTVKCKLENPNFIDRDGSYLQISTAKNDYDLEPGFGGAPVLDERGDVVGMLTKIKNSDKKHTDENGISRFVSNAALCRSMSEIDKSARALAEE